MAIGFNSNPDESFEKEEQLLAVENENLKSAPTTLAEKVSAFFLIFVPKQGYFITPILINLNLLIFIVMVYFGVDFMAPSTQDLLSWGANFRPLTLDGQSWRLLTNCFLHIGLFHLVFNMYALLYIGILLEPILGKTKFLAAYLLAGLLGSVTSLWWHNLIVSAGASGAIFGLYGVFLILLTTNLIEKNTRKELLTSIGFFVVWNLINGLQEGIDNAGHIGGLFAGLLIGYTYTLTLDEEENKITVFKTISALTVVISLISLAVYSSLTNDLVVYDTRMKEFAEMEKLALEVYSRAQYEPKEDLLYNIKDRGIYYWEENINLLNEVEKLDLPDEIHERNLKMKFYCELRIKTFRLLYKAIAEDTDKYKSQVQDLDSQVNSIINELKITN